MAKPLRILILEDSAADAELEVTVLQRAGFAPNWRRVETEADFLAGLAERPDVILADYRLPHFDALRALEVRREIGSDIPFIIVSGAIGEDLAVAAMRRGACDYLLKDRLARLGQAVSQALEQRKAAEAIRRSRDFYLTLFEEFPAMIWRSGEDARCNYFNKAWLGFTGRSLAEELGDGWWAGVEHDDLEMCQETCRTSMRAGLPFSLEHRLRHRSGEYRWVRNIGQPFRDLEGRFGGYIGACFDLHDQRQWLEDLRQSQHDLRALARRLHSVREEESTRLSREMHDVLGQNLTGLKMDLAWLQRRQDARKSKRETDALKERLTAMTLLVDETIQKVREYCAELRPGILDELGLVSATEWLVKSFEKRAEIRCELVLPPQDMELDRERATAMFRILQEILTNVARHAQATRVRVQLRQEIGHLILEVQDDGRGISAQDINNPASLGVLGMHERALAVGGTVQFQRLPQQGTSVAVRIPIGVRRSVASLLYPFSLEASAP